MSNYRKILIISLLIITVVLVVIAVVISRSSDQPDVGEFPVTNLDEEEIVVETGVIFTERVGTFDNQDPFFRNLVSVSHLATESMRSRLQNIIDKGLDQDAKPYDQEMEVVGHEIVSISDASATVRYSVRINASDGSVISQKEYSVKLEKDGKLWLVSDSTQITK